jgi:hypothetical protein
MRLRVLGLMFGTLMLTRCSSGTTGGTAGGGGGDDLLAPPAAGQGVQFKMVSHIEAGQEIERCQLFVAPEGGLFVHKDEVRFTAGSHHVLLYNTPYATIPTKNSHGVAVDAAKIHDCANGATDAWDVTGVIAGSQSSNGNTIMGELPDGVAITVAPGAVLLMDTHYLNASPAGLSADARINLYSIPQAEVKTEAGILFYYNPFIQVPANGSSTARMRCPVSKDITIPRLQSHMHRRGVGFAAELTDGTGAKISEVYTSATWEQVPAKNYDPLLTIKAGQALDYHCDYHNSEARDVTQGRSTKDEMCMLIGPYFPRDQALENCADETGQPAATWIGGGTTTCNDTISCLAGAGSEDAFYGCVVDSCSGASDQVSAVLRCQMTAGHGACDTACSGNGADCLTCLATACASEVSDCQAATCG